MSWYMSDSMPQVDLGDSFHEHTELVGISTFFKNIPGH